MKKKFTVKDKHIKDETYFFNKFHMNNIEITDINNRIKNLSISNNACDSIENFSGTNLETITFGDGIKKIGEKAFANNSKLKKVEFPSSLNEISEYAFENCTSLETIILKSNVSIKYNSFKNCNIKKIIFNNENIIKIDDKYKFISLTNNIYASKFLSISYYNEYECIEEYPFMDVKKSVISKIDDKLINKNSFLFSYNNYDNIYVKNNIIPNNVKTLDLSQINNSSIEFNDLSNTNINKIILSSYDNTKKFNIDFGKNKIDIIEIFDDQTNCIDRTAKSKVNVDMEYELCKIYCINGNYSIVFKTKNGFKSKIITNNNDIYEVDGFISSNEQIQKAINDNNIIDRITNIINRSNISKDEFYEIQKFLQNYKNEEINKIINKIYEKKLIK